MEPGEPITSITTSPGVASSSGISYSSLLFGILLLLFLSVLYLKLPFLTFLTILTILLGPILPVFTLWRKRNHGHTGLPQFIQAYQAGFLGRFWVVFAVQGFILLCCDGILTVMTLANSLRPYHSVILFVVCFAALLCGYFCFLADEMMKYHWVLFERKEEIAASGSYQESKTLGHSLVGILGYATMQTWMGTFLLLMNMRSPLSASVAVATVTVALLHLSQHLLTAYLILLNVILKYEFLQQTTQTMLPSLQVPTVLRASAVVSWIFLMKTSTVPTGYAISLLLFCYGITTALLLWKIVRVEKEMPLAYATQVGTFVLKLVRKLTNSQ